MGTGDIADRSVPTEASKVTNLGLNPINVDVGDFHTCLLNDNGTVWCFGNGSYGQLGNSQNEESNFIPVQVRFANGTALTDVSKVVAGAYHTCALRDDGTVWCWGANGYGQLGINSSTGGSNFPARVVDVNSNVLTEVIDITSSGYHTCVLKGDGTVWCWGWNYYGQIGDGTTTDSYAATQATKEDESFLTDITAVSAGRAHTCALAANGTVWCWGYNSDGRVGDGTAVRRSRAVQVKKSESEYLNGVVRLVVGPSSSWAITGDGSVYCWGSNYYGQLGVEVGDSSPYAVLMTALDVSEIFSGTYSTFAIAKDGYTYVWGTNQYGHLGLGDVDAVSSPTKLSGYIFNKLASSHYIHMCAISGLPHLMASPSSLIFTRPDQTQSVSVTNSGAEITSVVSSDPSVFEIRNDTCTGSSSDCTFEVVFKPKALIDYSGTVTVSYNGGSKTIAIEATLSEEAEAPVICTAAEENMNGPRNVSKAFLIVIRKGGCVGK